MVVVVSTTSGPGDIWSDQPFFLSAVLEFLSAGDLLHVTPLVGVAWHRESIRVWSWQASQIALHYAPTHVLQCWPQLCAAFPRGRFIAEGAYKQVFQVFAEPSQRVEASQKH